MYQNIPRLWKTKHFRISFDTQWSCVLKLRLWKQSNFTFSYDNTEATNWKCPSDHATHRLLLMCTLAVKCQTEAKENAYMETKLWCRGSAWNSNISVVSPLKGSIVATSTWRESFLQAFIVLFPLFFFSNDLNYYYVTLLGYVFTKNILHCGQSFTTKLLL